MGSVEPYETAGGRRYRVRYRDPERRSREKAGFATKRAAEEYLANITVASTRGEYVDPRSGRSTIGDLGAAWIASRSHLKPSALASLEIAWRCYVEPRWGRTEIARIRHSEVQTWISQLAAGTAPTSKATPRPLGATSVIRAHGVLAAVLDTAVKDRRISLNPARDIGLPRKVRKPHAYLSHTQVEALALEAGQHATLVRLLCYTGLRWGEATALRVKDLDMLRRRVNVTENAVRVNGRVIVGTPKSHRTRSVPFPAFLADDLARQCEGRARDALLFGNGLAHLSQPTAKGGWYVGAIARVKARDDAMPTPTIHDLRHTAASLAISTGANVKAVQRMLGHASAAMTLDVYADLFDDDLDTVSERLDDARARAVVGFSWGAGTSRSTEPTRLPRN